MNKLPFSRVLVLSPHADDAELGAGGTLSRLTREGAAVRLVSFSSGNEETGARRAEFEAAMDVLGIGDYAFYGYRTRHFPHARQLILNQIIAERDEFSPDLVIAPSRADTHQDHQVVTNEVVRSCKRLSVWGYEQSWNQVGPFSHEGFVLLEVRDVRKKIMALACYESQRNKVYTRESSMGSVLCMRGMQVGVPHAETFEVIRWVL